MNGPTVCRCGHPVYDHGRQNRDGNQIWVGCRQRGCACTTYRASDGSQWPNTHGGPVPPEPTDLHHDSEAWVGGQVLLAHEREPEIGAPT